MIADKNCSEFLRELSSEAPVPGGGGASGVAGAMGIALGSMVANLTCGKPKYAAVQEEIVTLLNRAENLRNELLLLGEKDAECFEPLAKAYRMPSTTEEEKKLKKETLEKELKSACRAPYETMQKAVEAMDVLARIGAIGTKTAISDIGVGTQLCKAALLGASMNVYINTRLMKDRNFAEELNRRTEALVRVGTVRADLIYKDVEAAVR